MIDQYIITEETLYNKVYLHGYNHKAWETIDPVVRSRPYDPQVEREKVLDEFWLRIISDSDLRKITPNHYSATLDRLLKIKESFRQEGKVENNDLPFDLTYKLEDFTPRKTVTDINKGKWQEGKVEK